RLSRKLQKKQSSLESDWLGANAEVRIARTGLTNAVVRQWPSFLADGFQPRMMELASSRGDEFVKFIKAQPQTDAWEQAEAKVKKLLKKSDEFSVKEAKGKRLIRTLENVLLEHNLPLVASEQRQNEVTRLLDLEHGVFCEAQPNQ
ncbi:MAG: hypothetical protein MI861_15550, partial [Pirellulales bacterium]|nr:hypothetical protein [Pirellulales bacterium]